MYVKKGWKMMAAGILGLQMLIQPVAMAIPASSTQEDGGVAYLSNQIQRNAGEEQDGAYYLSDIPVSDYKTGWGDLGINQGVDTSAKGLRLRINGEVKDFTKGVVIHPGTSQDGYATWDVSRYEATRFTAYVGINTGADGEGRDRGDAAFEVWADDQKIWGDGVFYKESGNAAYIDVAIPAGTQQLKLVTKSGPDMSCDHALFAEPKLYLSNLDQRWFTLSAQSSIISGQGSTVMVPRVENIFGTEDFTQEYTVTYATEDTDVVSVEETTGSVTAVSAGVATIRGTAVPKAGGDTLTATAQVEVTENGWTLASPDGAIVADLALDQEGGLRYTVTRDGEVTVSNGRLGIKTSLGDFVTGMTLQGEPEVTEINEDYEMISGKASTYHNHANQVTLTLALEDSQAQLQVLCRSYDDGFAYRYRIVTDEEQEMVVNGEVGSFTAPADAASVSMPNGSGNFSHEGLYSMKEAGTLSGKIVLPFLYQMGDNWVLMSEAALDGNYAGSVLDASGSTFTLGYPQQQGETVSTTAPFQSPWRFAVIGDITDIMENTMAENLSPAPDEDTYHFSEWVDPGVSSWTWLQGGFNVQRDPEAIKSYLDLAYEMGWNYFILDEGWQPNNPNYGQPGETKYEGVFDWFPEIVEYAEERNIGLIAWVPCDDLATEEQRNERLPYWSELGIKGIKVDFFDRESQDRIALMQEIYKDCAENRLLANVHGANKPTGEVRTYPNVLNREGINGEEMGYNRYEQLTLAPLTRGAVGPTDYTPRITPTGNITYAHQLAIAILFESGLPCMAGSVQQYETLTGASFLKNLPAAWDETVGLDTVPGQYITVARRSGQQWYLATNQGSGTREASIPLDFLGEGKYLAEIYTDTESGVDVQRTTRIVSREDTISASLKQGGACVVRLSQLNVVDTIDIVEGDVVVKEGESVQLTLDVIPEDYKNADILWSVDNDQLAQVTDGLVFAKNDGVVTVTAASALDGTVFDTCRVAITAKAQLSDQWTVVNPTNALTVAEDQDNQITIDTEAGDFTQKNVPKNKLVLEIGQGDFEISVKVNAEMTADFQTAALYVWDDTGALFAAQRRYHSFFGQNDNHHIYAAPNRNDVNSNMEEPWVQANPQDTQCYLKVVKKDGVLSAWYSLDGSQWNPIREDVTIPNLNTSETLQVGVFTSNGERNTVSVPVTFTDFTLNGEVIPFRGEEDTYVLWTDALENVNADYGTSAQDLNLPETVTVLLSDGTSKEVAVSWDASTYDPQTSGAQTLTGTLEDLGDVVNTLDVTAQVTVVVGDKPIAADKTLLQKTYDYALTLSTDGVTDSAKQYFVDTMAEAKAVLDDAKATQEQVNAAWDNLLEAIWGLGLTQGDKTMLELLIERADGMMADADKYVEANWQQLVDALATAKDVLADGDAMQEDVDKAADALLDAILAQRFKADKSILEELLNKAEGINLDGYTAESVATFRTALANAQAVMADNSLSEDDQAVVNQAVEQLTAAMDGLTAGGAPETTDKPEATDKPETTQKPEATQKPENNVPQTGDTAHMMGYVLSALATASLLLAVVVVEKRRRNG